MSPPNIRAAAALIILSIFACAMLSSHQNKQFPLLIDEAQATTIVCNPQPTPELIRWHRSKETRA